MVALVDRDPKMGTDRLASAILDFPAGHAIFTCSTQLIPYQRIQFLGTRGRIEIEIPFNAPNDRPTRSFIDSTGDLTVSGITTETFSTRISTRCRAMPSREQFAKTLKFPCRSKTRSAIWR